MKWLLAVDITEGEPELVVAEASQWAARAGATIDLVHVEGARYTYDFVTDPYVRDLMSAEATKMRDADEARLAKLLAAIPEAHRGAARLVPGRPVPAIVEASASYDTILVGTHGRTGLAHFWLGSIAEQIVRHCPKPVLVLRVPKGR